MHRVAAPQRTRLFIFFYLIFFCFCSFYLSIPFSIYLWLKVLLTLIDRNMPEGASEPPLFSCTGEVVVERAKMSCDLPQTDGVRAEANPPNSSQPLKPMPRYLTIKHAEDGKNLSKVSPFLVQRIMSARIGQVKNIKKLRDGSLLVETHNDNQTGKLLQLTNFSNDIPVKVEPHSKFNSCKGVIFCSDLVYLNKDELMKELSDQNVIDLYRVTRRVESQIVNTPTVILTFGTPDLPPKLRIGYYSVPVRQYLPNPTRCFKCQLFGHTMKYCSNGDNICGTCGETRHVEGMACPNPAKCANCQGSHPAFSKNCPRFLEEREIIVVAAEKRISSYAARLLMRKEKESRADGGGSYAVAVSSQRVPSEAKCVSCDELRKTVDSLTVQIKELSLQLRSFFDVCSKEKVEGSQLVDLSALGVCKQPEMNTTSDGFRQPEPSLRVSPIKLNLNALAGTSSGGGGVCYSEHDNQGEGFGVSECSGSESTANEAELLAEVKSIRGQKVSRSHKRRKKK